MTTYLEENMYDIQDVLQKISNIGFTVKINYKNKRGKHVIYLRHSIIKNGKQKDITKSLGVLTGTDKKKDFETLYKAMQYRDAYEKQINEPEKKECRIMLSDYVNTILKSHSNINTQKTYKAVIRHILKANIDMELCKIDKRVCMIFYEYLEKSKLISRRIIFSQFKHSLYKAISDDLIFDLPFLRNMNFKHIEPGIEFILFEDVKKIIETPTIFPEEKRALIFACFTGLRFCDLFHLKFTDIVDGRLKLKEQIKTKKPLFIKLHPIAQEILNNQPKGKDDKVFHLTSYEMWRRKVKIIFQNAGLSSKLTGHCARHTFATMLITSDVDLYTVSKLLGHTTISATHKYAKVIDKKKDEAIDKLPKI